MQKMTDKPVSVCPECKSAKVVKLISQTDFQLKGSGWYATDYKKSPPDPNKSKTEKPSSEPSTSEKKPVSDDSTKNKAKTESKD